MEIKRAFYPLQEPTFALALIFWLSGPKYCLRKPCSGVQRTDLEVVTLLRCTCSTQRVILNSSWQTDSVCILHNDGSRKTYKYKRRRKVPTMQFPQLKTVYSNILSCHKQRSAPLVILSLIGCSISTFTNLSNAKRCFVNAQRNVYLCPHKVNATLFLSRQILLYIHENRRSITRYFHFLS